MKKRFVLGFIFDPTLQKVLLIHKNRPEWQKGKINGLGGKIEKGEKPLESISREIVEECGLVINPDQWKLVTTLEGSEWKVEVFMNVLPKFQRARSLTDEKVEWFKVKDLPKSVIPNLRWLIPLSLAVYLNPDIKYGKILYR